MSSGAADDDLEGGGSADCYTNFVVVGIFAPGSTTPAMLEEFEVISDQPLTFNQIWARTQLAMAGWLQALGSSPKFRARFGSAPVAQVVGFGSARGC